METRILTIMLTDIQGFTQRTSSSSREALKELLDEHERLLYPVVSHYGGVLVKTIGDALLVTFESPTNAVLCGLAMQERLAAHNEGKGEEDQLNIRVAINSGEVQLRDGDVFGEAVNITARIEGITEAGEIYFTDSVYLAMNKTEVPSSEVGQKRLKGLPEAIKVYKVIRDPHSDQYRQLREKMLGLDLDENARPEFSLGGGGARPPEAPAQESPRDAAPAPAPRRNAWLSIAGALVLLVAAGAPAFFLLRDPMADDLENLRQAVDAGDFNRAVAIADDLVARFPGEAAAHQAVTMVVRAEVKDLEGKKDYPEALRRIAFHEEKLKPRAFPELRRAVLLAFGEHQSKDWNYARLSPIYGELLERHGDDAEVLRAIMEAMGQRSPEGPARHALNAAIAYLEKTDAPVDGGTAALVLDFLERRATDPFSRNSVKYRQMLAKRYADTAKDAQARMSGPCPARVHPFLLLKELEKLTAAARLNFYFIILHDVCRGARNISPLLEEAVAYVDANAGRPDWSALKRDAGIAPVAEMSNLGRGGFFARPTAGALIEGFLPEIEDMLLVAVGKRGHRYSDEDMRRINAWELLKLANLIDRVNVWAFHRDTLLSYGGRFKPRLMGGAIDYFAGHENKAKARGVLAEARDYLAETIATAMAKTGHEPGEFLAEYLADVKAALARETCGTGCRE
jgi:class 3 adenylate cyclase